MKAGYIVSFKYTFEDPDGFSTFGYTGLEFWIHPGTSLTEKAMLTLSLFSPPSEILFEFDRVQVDFGTRKAQCLNELILKCTSRDELLPPASVFEVRVSRSQGLNSFKEVLCGHRDVGTFSQHLQDRKSQQGHPPDENQGFTSFLFVQKDGTNANRPFEASGAFFKFVLFLET